MRLGAIPAGEFRGIVGGGLEILFRFDLFCYGSLHLWWPLQPFVSRDLPIPSLSIAT